MSTNDKEVTILGKYVFDSMSDTDFEQYNEDNVCNIIFGRDNYNRICNGHLQDVCHLLVTGKTLSGKSNFLHCSVISLLQNTPDNIKFLMIDPTLLEFNVYSGIPHLLVPTVTDPIKASGALSWIVNEMINRYKIFASNFVKNLESYNRKFKEKPLPRIVTIIDEIYNLDLSSSNCTYNSISQITLQGHRVGIHLIVSTKYENTAKMLRKLFPSEAQLFQDNDMRFLTYSTPIIKRSKILTSPYIPWEDIVNSVESIKEQYIDEQYTYNEKIAEEISSEEDLNVDEWLPMAIECVVEMESTSITLLQRRLRLGYKRASQIMDKLEERGIVGPSDDGKTRKVLLTKQQFENKYLIGTEE